MGAWRGLGGGLTKPQRRLHGGSVEARRRVLTSSRRFSTSDIYKFKSMPS